MTEDEEKEKARLQAVKKEEERKKQEEKERKKEEEGMELEFRQQKAAINEKRIQKYTDQERKMLEMKAQPIRDAILENIGEILSSGVAEVCEKMPEDPVEYLVSTVLNV